MTKPELLAPAGDFEKLKTAFYFGADAVYVGGKEFSLRALAGNFTNEELEEATKYTHEIGKKIYVTVNIFARNTDLEKADEYFAFLEKIGVDGVIISDLGLISIALKRNLNVNVSTQASILNKATVQIYKDLGVKRVILARELSLKEVKEISSVDIEVETFIHGAMCISYSGRCLLSNYLTGRDSNRGACVQACRWEYSIREKNTDGEYLEIEEDDKGTYILNSKDLNLIDYIGDLVDAGVVSFKIEGRMKSDYYLATVINAYRRAIDAYFREGEVYKENPLYMTELKKTAHRCFTTAYAFGENDKTVNYDDSQSKGTHKFMAKVLDFNEKEGYALIEMRNRFKKGEVLEVLSPNDTFNKQIVIEKMLNLKDEEVLDAKFVQEKLKLFTDIKLQKGDMLRKEF
ncbi:MAG: U32 family peptidase [Clostridiales bacterium]|nr:U32 family peptidase [Clostridiales bacterium]